MTLRVVTLFSLFSVLNPTVILTQIYIYCGAIGLTDMAVKYARDLGDVVRQHEDFMRI